MSTPDHRPTLPAPRGALSERTLDALRTDPGALAPHADELAHVEAADRALTLRVLHELSYRGFRDVSETAEWEPAVLTVRRHLQVALEARLRSRWPGHHFRDDDFADQSLHLIEGRDGPPVASYVRTHATREQVLEFHPLALDLSPQGG